ncbi:hypothetical protein BLL52_4264 [Rhodoferax antarcticus ANT.BR]|uniref:Uncharacterized protein n=1 Tax=Rhodoferax antarcticus ANT.BR TaxID=1111071 RepID=A0A1Q8Y9E1_9BURK|nr:hypothetical protein BLL52_4264 [Rhodoferax antarcticus ANT.BR]
MLGIAVLEFSGHAAASIAMFSAAMAAAFADSDICFPW